MQAKKTLLAIALGTATLGASAYETEYGNAYADVKVRYETNDTDDATDNDAATGLITDAAVGFDQCAHRKGGRHCWLWLHVDGAS